MKKIILIGRPNVGKSTLFNMLTRSRLALVHEVAGTTRDLREKEIEFNGHKYLLIDSAGLENDKSFFLSSDMTKKTLEGVDSADIILFLVDGKAGIHPMDEHFAKLVRRLKKPIILVANKCESVQSRREAQVDFLKLGLGGPICISASQNQNMDLLFAALNKILKIQDVKEISEDLTLNENEEIEKPIKVAIIGKPNSGKSTLTNSIVGKNVMLTGDFANLTRESVEHKVLKKGKEFIIIDTAGVRKSIDARKDEMLYLSKSKTWESIEKANVVVLLIDIVEGLQVQDLKLAEKAVEEGRPVIIVLNKDDALEDSERFKKINDANDTLNRSFNQLKGISVMTISALKNKGVPKLFEKILKVYQEWNYRVPTSALNKWLDDALSTYAPPLSKNKSPMKVKYITQIGIRPPSFVLFVGSASDLPENYRKYLVNSIIKTFDLTGTPVRLKVNIQKNKYVDNK